MKWPWLTEPVHAFIVHPILFLLPDRHARAFHDWHAALTFACTPEQAKSAALPESTTEAFVRGLLVGLIITTLFFEGPTMAKHLFVATLAGAGRIDADHAECIHRLRVAAANEGIKITVRYMSSGGVDRNRNLAVAEMLKSEADALFFLDSGLIFDERDALAMYRSTLQGIIGGAPPGKAVDWKRVADAARMGAPAEVLPWLASDPMVSVDPEQFARPPLMDHGKPYMVGLGVSTACMLVRRATLERFIATYRERIEYVTDPGFDAGHRKLHLVFHHQRDPANDTPSGGYKGEDYAFCTMWRQMGGQVWVYADAKLIQRGSLDFRYQLSRVLAAARAQRLIALPGD